jgi:hypothetical protein
MEYFFLLFFIWSPYRITNPYHFPFKGLKIVLHFLRSLPVFPFELLISVVLGSWDVCPSQYTKKKLFLSVFVALQVVQLGIRTRWYIPHEKVICRDPPNSTNWESRITRRLGYEHTFCQNAVSTKKLLLLIYIRKNVTCLSVGLLRIRQVFLCLL